MIASPIVCDKKQGSLLESLQISDVNFLISVN